MSAPPTPPAAPPAPDAPPAEARADRAPARGGDHHALLALALLAPLALVVLALFASPDPRGHGTHEQLGLPACRFERWLGLPCPGCGCTTSATLLVHGRFLEAFVNQPFGFLAALALPLVAAAALREHLRGGDVAALFARALGGRRGWTLAALVLAGWVWKLVLTFSG